MFENFPYSNFHDLNADWIINRVKNVETSEANAKASEQAAAGSATAAAQSAQASAQSAQASAQSAEDSAQSAEASANSATEADNYVSSTRAQVNLLQSRVDNIIPNQTQTEGNTELLDIRVGYNGITYPSAGDAVRKQINDVYNSLNNIESNLYTNISIIYDKTIGTVSGAFKIIDAVGSYILKIPTQYFKDDNFLAMHPKNMKMVGTSYQIFWSDSDAFTTSARRAFTTDTAVLRKNDNNNTTYEYVYIPVSNNKADFEIIKPLKYEDVPFDFMIENLNKTTNFSILASSGLIEYNGTAKISNSFYIDQYLYTDSAINLFVYNNDGTFDRQVSLINGKNYLTSYIGKIGVLAYINDKKVAYDTVSTIGTINKKYLSIAKTWEGKTLYCYGDSVTEQGYWQPYLNRICKFDNVINGGHSGYRLMLLATDEHINEITDSFDIMVIMAGINDWTQDRSIGTINDVNTDEQVFTGTFYGGLNQMLNTLTTKWPDRRFVFITPTYTWLNDDTKFFNQTGHGDVNSLGLTMRDYADAMINACKKWNVPCIDLLSQIGWNKNNVATYVKNDPTTVGGVTYANYSHPNPTGAKIMASVIASYLETIAPIK